MVGAGSRRPGPNILKILASPSRLPDLLSPVTSPPLIRQTLCAAAGHLLRHRGAAGGLDDAPLAPGLRLSHHAALVDLRPGGTRDLRHRTRDGQLPIAAGGHGGPGKSVK